MDEVFLDVLDTGEQPDSLDDLFFFDLSDSKHKNGFVGLPFHLSLDPDEEVIDSHVIDHFLFKLDHDELCGGNESFDTFAYVLHVTTWDCAHK